MSTRVDPDTRRDEILLSLYQHRLLACSQLHRMHAPEGSLAWTRRVVHALVEERHVERVRRNRTFDYVCFLTKAGAALVAESRGLAQRGSVLTAAKAAFKMAHTVAVNDVGLAFLAAARQRGDVFSFMDWEPEVAHRHPERKGTVISDALLNYTATGAGRRGGDVTLSLFIELDRGTETTARLVAKLQDYLALYRCYREAGEGRKPRPPRWVARYSGAFPYLVVVFAGLGDDRRLRARRIRQVAEACGRDANLGHNNAWPILFCDLTELEERGPFEPVFFFHTDSTLAEPVNVLGQPQAAGRGRS